MSEELPLAVAIVLERSVITFGGVEQTKLPEQSANMIRALSAEVEALRSMLDDWVSHTGCEECCEIFDGGECDCGTVDRIERTLAFLKESGQ